MHIVPGCLLVHLLQLWWEGVVKNVADHDIRVVAKLFQALLNTNVRDIRTPPDSHPIFHEPFPKGSYTILCSFLPQWYLQIIFLYQRFIHPLPTSMYLLPRGFLVNPPTFLMNLFPRSSFTISLTVILHGLTHTFPYLHSPRVHSQFLLL